MYTSEVYRIFRKCFAGFHPSIPIKKENIGETSDKFQKMFGEFCVVLNKEFIEEQVKALEQAKDAYDRAISSSKLSHQTMKEVYQIALQRERNFQFVLWVVILILAATVIIIA